jgi:hypothetical protein
VPHEFPAPDQRVLRGVAASLTWQPVDSDGSPADPGAAVTVDVTRSDGSTIATGAATTGTTSAPRAYALAAANNLTLDYLTATWKVGGVATATTYISVVGGYYASIAEIRAAEPSLVETKWPDEVILRARWETEAEFERISGVPFVPRLMRGRYSGTGGSSLVLDHGMLRSVRTIRYYSDATTFQPEQAANTTAIPPNEFGIARFVTYASFNEGLANVEIFSEHGYDRPPADVRRAFFARVRSRVTMSKSGIPDEATTYTPAEGGGMSFVAPPAWKSICEAYRLPAGVA